MRTAAVTIRDRDGRQFKPVTMAASFEANAIDWFRDNITPGPAQTPAEVDLARPTCKFEDGPAARGECRSRDLRRFFLLTSLYLRLIAADPLRKKTQASFDCGIRLESSLRIEPPCWTPALRPSCQRVSLLASHCQKRRMRSGTEHRR